MNWIDANNNLPPIMKSSLSCTKDVWVKGTNGTKAKGYYDYDTQKWWHEDASVELTGITNWAEINITA